MSVLEQLKRDYGFNLVSNMDNTGRKEREIATIL